MKELSVFIDESGDFGEYEIHSPYYIISMVCHDQANNIDSKIAQLDQELSYLREHNIEGIVFWKDGEPRCKIKRSDFGFAWPENN